MKNLTYIVALFFIGWSASANSDKTINFSPYNYGEAFIFVEGDVEFAVYRNGEFDFYYNPQFARHSGNYISSPRENISYNAGYNYDLYVQYDDYGAVIQIEDVPVYYDYYGRIIQAGNVYMNYNSHGNIVRVGNMHVRYNRFNQPIRYIGSINQYNSHYVYQPWHQYYMRPHQDYRVVYYQPYRAYYEPSRINYIQYSNYYQNNNNYINKNNFYRPGQQGVAYNQGRRTSTERNLETTLRSSRNVTRNTSSNAEVKNTAIRGNAAVTRRTENNSSTNRVRSEKEISNIENHRAAVNAQRGRTTESIKERNIPSQVQNVNRRSTTTKSDYPVQARSEQRTNSTENRARVEQRQKTVSRTSVPERNTTVSRTSVPERNTRIQRTQNDTNGSNVRAQNNSSRTNPVRATSRSTSSKERRSSERR
jgi:hypothetical protein